MIARSARGATRSAKLSRRPQEIQRRERFTSSIKSAEAENRRLAKRLAAIIQQTGEEIRHLELTLTSMEDECHSLRYERDAMESTLDEEQKRATKQLVRLSRSTLMFVWRLRGEPLLHKMIRLSDKTLSLKR